MLNLNFDDDMVSRAKETGMYFITLYFVLIFRIADATSTQTHLQLYPLINHTNANTTVRPPCPPPHLLSQIVEMGFSVSQARKALSTTKDGVNVSPALEETYSKHGYGDSDANGSTLSILPVASFDHPNRGIATIPLFILE